MIGVPSFDIWHILRELGYSSDLFIGRDPDVAGTYVIITDRGSGPSFNAKWLRDEFSIQFRVKVANEHQYLQGYNELLKIKNLLYGVNTKRVSEVETDLGDGVDVDGTIFINLEEREPDTVTTIKETDYIRFLLSSEPAFVAYDDNDRPIFTMNMNVMREERQATGNREPLQ